MNQSKEMKITKEFVEKNIMIGFSYDEIREVFGTEQHTEIMDNTMNFLYDSTNYKPFSSKRKKIIFIELTGARAEEQDCRIGSIFLCNHRGKFVKEGYFLF
ncbi:hypothetical protein [Bacillus massiliigorillae]|uniref:hypothetical protein n=1 Tax=Bacillus massiliigorillae TaxID=1243664 RepID=UPI0003A6DA1A|nr:hypothetical protein [Bacillus massiliigorillae]